MTDRIIDLSDEPAYLHVNLDRLVIERKDREPVTLPLADLAALVVSHPQIRLSQAVLSRAAAAGASLIVCDNRRMPIGMLLPLEQNHIQGHRFLKQAQASVPTKKQLWKQIIKAKIKAQANLLKELCGGDQGLSRLIPSVKSGDKTNCEAQASRIYWPVLFDNPLWHRDREADDQNRHLNYGYAVLRAIVTRAICASGLHPSLGLHHHNRYNAFCLADDLMEPFRPIVDRVVVLWTKENDPSEPLNRLSKSALLKPLTGRFLIEGEARTLFDILTRTAQSLASAYEGSEKRLYLPELLPIESLPLQLESDSED